MEDVDLLDPELLGQFSRFVQLQVLLQEELPDGSPHVETMPSSQQLADILEYLRQEGGVTEGEELPRLTIQNDVDTLVAYVGRGNWLDQCRGVEDPPSACAGTGWFSTNGMARAFLNSLIVSVPATILPLLFAAFAGYAFSWFDFPGRQWMFVVLAGLQIVPLQMTLIPIFRIYADLGLTGSFLGVWLFHTGFGLPYAIYLTRNFMSALPRDLFASPISTARPIGPPSGGWQSRSRCLRWPLWASSSSSGSGTISWWHWSSSVPVTPSSPGRSTISWAASRANTCCRLRPSSRWSCRWSSSSRCSSSSSAA